ncbi:unnamed protein product [Mytilus coruscus]|uniref:QRICH1-like domain-containing protein n=1 Tax=Mytilus coruscus TaxID=42192 RepID=A0A6J7ZTM0_MYTCO|nr:unnamed protein product [Mytilus coruscus]
MSSQENMTAEKQNTTIFGTEQDLTDATKDIELSQIALEGEEEIQLTQAAAAAENDFSLTQFVLDAATAGEANQPNFDVRDFDMSFLGTTDNSNNRFSAVVSNEEITNLISEQKNKNTEKNTKWAINVFNECLGERIRTGIIMPDLLHMDYISMNFWLQRFVIEARKKNGDEYLPPKKKKKSIYYLFCGVMRYCRDNGLHVNFFIGDDATFAGSRCLYEHFETYLNSLENDGCFYRKPLTSGISYGKQPLGMNKLGSLMKEMCGKAGLKGNFTNHSGKRSCSTSLDKAGLDEQSIMDRTGHRSTAVRAYKTKTNEIEEKVSMALNPPSEENTVGTRDE